MCTLEEDAKGRMVVAQSVPKERYAAGEKGPAVGIWREIGGGNHASSGKPAFDLARYKAAAQMRPPHQGAYPQGEESLLSAPQEPQPEPQAADNPHRFEELGF